VGVVLFFSQFSDVAKLRMKKLVKESQLNINDYLNSFNFFLKTRINVSKVVL
jgi:hypothetical protein